jgi:hypothetical protein
MQGVTLLHAGNEPLVQVQATMQLHVFEVSLRA